MFAFGLIVGFVSAAFCQVVSERSSANNGIVKLNGKYYYITPIKKEETKNDNTTKAESN